MGKENMGKKIVCIFVCMLLIITLLPISVIAGDKTNPEISDKTGDARTIIDIQKAWFFEDPTTLEYLYVIIQVAFLQPKYPGTLLNDVYWMMNNVNYYVGGGLGIYLSGIINPLYVAVGIVGTNTLTDITGFLDFKNNTITCKIPKSLIGNPHAGDVLTKTCAGTSQRTPFMEKLGWDAYFRTWLFRNLRLPLLGWLDRAPDTGYGKDYTIQY
jgi:hypothetical protein